MDHKSFDLVIVQFQDLHFIKACSNDIFVPNHFEFIINFFCLKTMMKFTL
jgi:hypothetical protein